MACCSGERGDRLVLVVGVDNTCRGSLLWNDGLAVEGDQEEEEEDVTRSEPAEPSSAIA